jgi:hypothetical protein
MKVRFSTIIVNIRNIYDEFIKAICGMPQSCSSEECVMFPFALSLFDFGLLIIVVILVLFYLIVLIKLKPSTEGEKTPRTKSLKQNIHESFSTELRSNPVVHHENREEPMERFKAIENPESAPTVSVDAKKPESPRNNNSSGCPHHFGYLKEHPKHTPIPNECLTCTRIMECLAGGE